MNFYLFIILAVLIGRYILFFITETLNLARASAGLPEELEDVYDAGKYKKAQSYLKDKTNFSLAGEAIVTVILVVFILGGGFNFVDGLARSLNRGQILTGLIFTAILILAYELLSIPFSAYHTFVIEERYGFNRTTAKTFILDLIKTWLLGAIIGGIILSFVLWIFLRVGKPAWIFCWLGVVLLRVFLIFIAPVFILPLFNKFIPLEEGELKDRIREYARSQRFGFKDIFKIDASRRSSKSNAFFTGFGKSRRIALYDTLIEKHTTDELVSVLDHEIGHYRKGHIIKGMVLSVVTTGIFFFILAFFLNNPGLFAAFKMQHISIYASLFFSGFLYVPVNMALSVFANFLSRRHEYEADAYAVKTFGKPEAFINALKRLSVDNLSNLTPHPLKVFFDYSHPPVLQRIRTIRGISAASLAQESNKERK